MVPLKLMFDKEAQSENAPSPIVVTLLGIVTLDKEVQVTNAPLRMVSRFVKYFNSSKDVAFSVAKVLPSA